MNILPVVVVEDVSVPVVVVEEVSVPVVVVDDVSVPVVVVELVSAARGQLYWCPEDGMPIMERQAAF